MLFYTFHVEYSVDRQKLFPVILCLCLTASFSIFENASIKKPALPFRSLELIQWNGVYVRVRVRVRVRAQVQVCVCVCVCAEECVRVCVCVCLGAKINSKVQDIVRYFPSPTLQMKPDNQFFTAFLQEHDMENSKESTNSMKIIDRPQPSTKNGH